MSEFKVKFDEVCEWFHGCDRLKIILIKNYTKLYFILKIIKNYHQYISFIYRRKKYEKV